MSAPFRVEGYVERGDGTFRPLIAIEAERIAANRAKGRLPPATHRMGADGVPVPIAAAPAPAPAQPDPALVAQGERILAEIAARKAASPPPRKRTPEETAAIDREYDRVQAEWERAELDKLAHDSVHGFGKAFRPWPPRD